MTEKINSYKGFKKDMTCRGFKYEEGETYKEENANVCNAGFHACEYPLDCFSYYPPATSVYHEVIQSGSLSKSNCDTKVSSTKIKIGAEIGIAGIVKAAIKHTKSRTTTECTDENAATAGEYGVATAGEYGAATAGEYGAATAGGVPDRGKQALRTIHGCTGTIQHRQKLCFWIHAGGNGSE